MKNIKEIRFPNNIEGENQNSYRLKTEQRPNGVDEIRPIMKSGEMAGIQWFEIIKDNKIIAEIKESVCDIYGEDELPDKVNIPF